MLDQFCKYKIGQTLAIRAQVDAITVAINGLPPEKHADQFERQWMGAAQRCVVLERIVQECYGGIQVHYLLSVTSYNRYDRMPHTVTNFKLTEPELVPYPEEEPVVDAAG